MTSDPEVVILHSVAVLFDEAAADELHGELETRLPDLDVALAGTHPPSTDLVRSASAVLTALPAPELLERAPELEWIQATNAGVDAYDLDRVREAGLLFTNASGVGAEPIAEQVLGYMLVFERGLDRAMRQQHANRWERFRGGELLDKTVGIVGLGAIGSRIADLASALGMRVIGTKRDLETVPEPVDRAFAPDDLDRVLAESAYVVLACPLTEATEGLIGSDELDRMDENAVLVNIARGPVVDEPALIDALDAGTVGGAALDVVEDEPLAADSPLWTFDNALITPHMAGYTPRYMQRCADLFERNYEAFSNGAIGEMTNRIV